jgi:hypothetical protein
VGEGKGMHKKRGEAERVRLGMGKKIVRGMEDSIDGLLSKKTLQVVREVLVIREKRTRNTRVRREREKTNIPT